MFGLAIHHQNGINIFGPNTKFGKLEIPYVDGEGVVVYTIPELPLLEGGYAISVAAVNDDDTETFDYHDRAYTFQVYTGDQTAGYGMVTLDGNWQWQASVEPETDCAHNRNRELTMHDRADNVSNGQRSVRSGLRLPALHGRAPGRAALYPGILPAPLCAVRQRH